MSDMSDIVIRIDRDVMRRALRRARQLSMLAAAMILPVSELSSESVTLSTYYPAPSGVYTQMITMGKTILAQDGASVTIGKSVAGLSKTHAAKALAMTSVTINGTVDTATLMVGGGGKPGQVLTCGADGTTASWKSLPPPPHRLSSTDI